MAARSLSFSYGLQNSSPTVSHEQKVRSLKSSVAQHKKIVGSSVAFGSQRRQGTLKGKRAVFQIRSTTEEAAPAPSADDRTSMYAAFVAAKDRPEWNPAKFISSTQLSPGVRNVVLEIEASREYIQIQNSYNKVGMKAQLKVAHDSEGFGGHQLYTGLVSSSPIDPEDKKSWDILLKVRGDIKAGQTKTVSEEVFQKYMLNLHVNEDEELYNITEDSNVEVGPFAGGGLLLKSIHGIFRHRTILIFAQGGGQATARALFNAQGQKGLNLCAREQARAYYLASTAEELYYMDESAQWEKEHGLIMRVATVEKSDYLQADSLTALFDDDDLEYDPETTGALVLCDSPEEELAIKAFLESEGELSSESIVLGSEEDKEMVLLQATVAWQELN